MWNNSSWANDDIATMKQDILPIMNAAGEVTSATNSVGKSVPKLVNHLLLEQSSKEYGSKEQRSHQNLQN